MGEAASCSSDAPVDAMTSLTQAAKRLVPRPLKQGLRAYHRDVVLRRSARRIAGARVMPELSGEMARALTYGWGNEGMAANTEFLRAVYAHAVRARGHIVECGAGISTVALGLAAGRTGGGVLTLEHHGSWAQRTRDALTRLGIHNVHVCHAPLATFGEYSWYAPPEDELPASIVLAVCDGPPGDTPGGRYGLLPRLHQRLAPQGVILLDDVERAAELDILHRWASELGCEPEIVGESKPYGVLRVPADWSPARAEGNRPATGHARVQHD